MFPKKINLNKFNQVSKGTMIDNLGIEIIEISEDYILAKMPVDSRTVQPFGLLHGGASVALAETLGSYASNIIVGDEKVSVGLEINANHVKSVESGFVYGKAKAVHIGRKTHIWEIKITDEKERLICISRLTMAILDK